MRRQKEKIKPLWRSIFLLNMMIVRFQVSFSVPASRSKVNKNGNGLCAVFLRSRTISKATADRVATKVVGRNSELSL